MKNQTAKEILAELRIVTVQANALIDTYCPDFGPPLDRYTPHGGKLGFCIDGNRLDRNELSILEMLKMIQAKEEGTAPTPNTYFCSESEQPF